jgi:PST family polysaccharide transporter
MVHGAAPTPDTLEPVESVPESAAAAASKPSIGQRAMTGAMWMTSLAIATKAAGFVTQLALAWLLLPEDFGLISLVYTVTVFGGLIVNPGIDTILVQRYAHLRRWITLVFWMGLTFALLGAGVMVAAAPIAARIYDRPELIGLIAVIALATPIGAVALVPRAILRAEMMFGRITSIQLVYVVLNSAITIAAAAMGLGAYSFVVSMPVTAAITTAMSWWMIPRSSEKRLIAMRLHLRRWKYLFGDGSALFIFGLIVSFIAQFDYMFLGLLYNDEQVGFYYFSFNLSLQTFMLMNAAVSAVSLPALVSVRSPEARSQLLVSGVRLLAFVSIPFAFLQAALTEPTIELVFDKRWRPTVELVQVLCLGMAFRATTAAAQSLMQAQGRYWAMVLATGIEAAVFVALLIVLTLWQGLIGAASAVAITCLLSTLNALCFALKDDRKHFWGLLRTLSGIALLAGLLAIPVVWSAPRILGHGPWVLVVGLVGLSLLYGTVYWAAARWIYPDLLGLLMRKLPGRSGYRVGEARPVPIQTG